MLNQPIITGIMISHIRRSCHFCCSNRLSFATRRLFTQTSTLKQKRSNKSHRLEAFLYQSRQQSSVSYMMAEPLDDCIDSSQRQTYDLSDILKYLDQIEDILNSDKLANSSPAFKYQHCYPGNDDDKQTFYKVVGNVLAKPMLRSKYSLCFICSYLVHMLISFAHPIHIHSSYIWRY